MGKGAAFITESGSNLGAAGKEGEEVEYLAIRVITDEEDTTFTNISSWEMTPDATRVLTVYRRGLPVGCWKQWREFELSYTLKSGGRILLDREESPPEDVGLGVEVKAIGGRTS